MESSKARTRERFDNNEIDKKVGWVFRVNGSPFSCRIQTAVPDWRHLIH